MPAARATYALLHHSLAHHTAACLLDSLPYRLQISARIFLLTNSLCVWIALLPARRRLPPLCSLRYSAPGAAAGSRNLSPQRCMLLRRTGWMDSCRLLPPPVRAGSAPFSGFAEPHRLPAGCLGFCCLRLLDATCQILHWFSAAGLHGLPLRGSYPAYRLGFCCRGTTWVLCLDTACYLPAVLLLPACLPSSQH